MPDRSSDPRHAFLAESARPSLSLMVSTIVATASVDETRRNLRSLRAPGQRRIHFATEIDRRRRSILDAIMLLPVTSVAHVVRHHDQERSRAAILHRAPPDLARRGVSRIVLESRRGQDRRDRTVLFSAVRSVPGVVYEHRTPHDEPLLWIPDALAWAWGRGGSWRRRVEAVSIAEIVVIGL